MTDVAHDIILFDGVCNLCSASVQFIIKQDKYAQYKFASLQSEFAKNLLAAFGVKVAEVPQSILLVRGARLYSESSAALHIAQKLDGGYKLLPVFLIVPQCIRDFVYRWIARNRYKWFGKKDACMVATKALKDRFLD